MDNDAFLRRLAQEITKAHGPQYPTGVRVERLAHEDFCPGCADVHHRLATAEELARSGLREGS